MRVIGVVIRGFGRVLKFGLWWFDLVASIPSRIVNAIVWRLRNRKVIDGDETELIIQIAAAGSRLSQAMANGDIPAGRQGLSVLRTVVSEIRQGRRGATIDPSVPVRPSGRIRFIVDSLFLAGAKRFLIGNHPDQMSGVRERFHFCTGIKLDAQTYALTHIVPVDFAEQSAIHLRVDTSSAISALAALDHWGTPLVAHCHSHPGRGAGATFPSVTDRRFQDILERGSHIAIGLIFSQDGYLRCFAGDESRFEISVFGNQVTEIEKNVYKIELGDEKLPIANVNGRVR